MASGWGPAEGVNDQIEQTMKDRMRASQVLLQQKGQEECEDCGEQIPLARRKAIPSAIRCIKCQSIFESMK